MIKLHHKALSVTLILAALFCLFYCPYAYIQKDGVSHKIALHSIILFLLEYPEVVAMNCPNSTFYFLHVILLLSLLIIIFSLTFNKKCHPLLVIVNFISDIFIYLLSILNIPSVFVFDFDCGLIFSIEKRLVKICELGIGFYCTSLFLVLLFFITFLEHFTRAHKFCGSYYTSL